MSDPIEIIDRRTAPMSHEEHSRMCAASERKLNERFDRIYDKLIAGGERMTAIEASINQIKDGLETSVSTADDRMDRIDAGLQQNTAVTQEVKDILDTAKGAFRFFWHMGNAVKWVLGFGAVALGFWVALKNFRSH